MLTSIIYVYFVPSEPPPLSRGCATKGLKHRWVSLVQCEPTPEKVCKIYGYSVQSEPPSLARGCASKGWVYA